MDITGEIQVAMKYNREKKVLLIKVIQARELVPRDVIGYSDPYAVIKIVPDRYRKIKYIYTTLLIHNVD